MERRPGIRKERAANERLEREVAERLRLQRALLDAVDEGVMIARADGTLDWLNAVAREFTGLGDEDIGAPLTLWVERLQLREAGAVERLEPGSGPLERALRGEVVRGQYVFGQPRQGTERVARVTAVAVRGPDGRIEAAVATLHDLTELRRLEDEREEFLSIVSHELRTPLTPLKALAQLQLARLVRARANDAPLDLESLERNLMSIERQVDRMNGLVTDLLSVSRAGRGHFEMDPTPLDLVPLARDVVQRYIEATREEGRHRFDLRCPDALVVNADHSRIEQLLMNLIGNAVKYSPRGGEVRVSVARRDGHAEIVISDDGIGIPAAELPLLGGAFVRGGGRAASFAGVGIGLHVARLVAVGHGGSLDLESAGDDKGATVRVRLPAQPG